MGSLPLWLNPFDVLIAFGLVAGVALGFMRGLIRMVMSLLVLYVAAVFAMTFYVVVGGWIRYVLGLSRSVTEALAFAIILVAVVSLLNFILRRTYKDTELPGVRQIDQLGGMAIGFVLTCIWIGLALVVLAFFMKASADGVGSFGRNIIGYFRSSNLIPIFYDFLPIALATLKPWMPGGLPPEILRFRL